MALPKEVVREIIRKEKFSKSRRNDRISQGIMQRHPARDAQGRNGLSPWVFQK